MYSIIKYKDIDTIEYVFDCEEISKKIVDTIDLAEDAKWSIKYDYDNEHKLSYATVCVSYPSKTDEIKELKIHAWK